PAPMITAAVIADFRSAFALAMIWLVSVFSTEPIWMSTLFDMAPYQSNALTGSVLRLPWLALSMASACSSSEFARGTYERLTLLFQLPSWPTLAARLKDFWSLDCADCAVCSAATSSGLMLP